MLSDQKLVLDDIETIVTEAAENSRGIAPHISKVMRAFEQDANRVRVLLVGQDPYPTAGHAVGLSFATAVGTKPLPRSLANMMKELTLDLPNVSAGADLTRWETQGVLLLNRHLTTQIGQAGAHSSLGWIRFTDAAVKALAELHGNKLVALLWGNQAQTLTPLLSGAQVLRGVHPSPLSAHRGFFGSRPYSKANELLESVGAKPIDWSC